MTALNQTLKAELTQAVEELADVRQEVRRLLKEEQRLNDELILAKDDIRRLQEDFELEEKKVQSLTAENSRLRLEIKEADAKIARQDAILKRYQKWIVQYQTIVSKAKSIKMENLQPKMRPMDFGISDWDRDIPDTGQEIGRYLPGQPSPTEGARAIGFRRWAVGDNLLVTPWALASFFEDSVDKWREIGTSTPAKPLFRNLARFMRLAHLEILEESKLVSDLVSEILSAQ